MQPDTPPPATSEAGTQASAAEVRHALRTPLNHIIGYSEMLEEEARERGLDDLVPDLSRVLQAARTLHRMIETLLGDADANVAPPAEAAESETSAARPDTAEAADTVRAQLAAARVEAVATSRSRLGARLLVVDDSEQNRDLLSRRLRERGHTVLTAAGGGEALRIVESETVDLVLLDVMMPDISGIEVLRALRARHAVADLPVIMVTGLDRSQDTVAALQLGANDYVTKPLDFQVVLARTETQLELMRAKQRIDQLAADLEARNGFIRATFDRYVSADIAERLLATSDGPRLSGERRRVTILLCDLRGFTPLVQRYDPEQVVRVLNRYLTRMTEVIAEHGGTIDEFTGDGLLALFGAPVALEDDALRAVACAVRMQIAMEGVNAVNEREGMPHLEMGIGIDTGEVLVGSIGSMMRAKYTAIGSSVNLAARIESFTVGGQVLISSATRRAAGSRVVVGTPVRIDAKGFRAAVEVFEVRGVDGPQPIAVPSAAAALRPLSAPVPVRCTALEGKHLEGTPFEGEIVAVGAGAAAVRVSQNVWPLLNLQMLLCDASGPAAADDVYCKVVEIEAASSRSAIVRFTSLPPDAAAYLHART